MRRAMVVARREVRSLFEGPLAYLFLAAFTVASLVTWRLSGLFDVGQATARLFFQNLDWTLFILVPPLAMRQWAEEARSGTLELLMTWPVTLGEVVLGKFLSGAFLLLVALGLTVPAAFMLGTLGDLDPGPVLAGYFGAFLLGCAYLAACTFVSSFTKSQMAAFLASLVTCVALWLPGEGLLLGYLPPSLVEVGQSLGLGARLRHFEGGFVRLSDVAYYLSFVCVLVPATALSLGRLRDPS
ncbi:MAG: ABC transporter permease [Planctomycetota bacterium]